MANQGAIKKGEKRALKEVKATALLQVRLTVERRENYAAYAKKRGVTLSRLVADLLESAMSAA
jgi:tryptophan synthase alpha subunit